MILTLLDQIALANKLASQLVGRSSAHLIEEEVAWLGYPGAEKDEGFMRHINERMFVCEGCQHWYDAKNESARESTYRLCESCGQYGTY